MHDARTLLLSFEVKRGGKNELPIQLDRFGVSLTHIAACSSGMISSGLRLGRRYRSALDESDETPCLIHFAL
jgi:hypothetical protein